MIQNSNSLEGIPLAWSYRNVFLYIKLDSKNKIFRFGFKGPKNQQASFEALAKIIENEELDFLCENLMKRCFEFEAESMPFLFNDPLFQKSAFQLKQALLFLKGVPPDYLRRTDFGTRFNPNDLLCNCIGVVNSDVPEFYRTYHGNKNEFVRCSDVSMNCGQCKNDLNQLWKEISEDSLLNMEVKLSELKEKLKVALVEFSDFTHLELAENDLEIVEISDEFVSLRGRKKIANIDQTRLENALVNYFNGHLKMNIKVVFLGTH